MVELDNKTLLLIT